MHEKGQRYQEFRDLIIELIKLYHPHTYCEIGVRKGYTFNSVCHLVERAIAVDIAPFRGIKRGKKIKHFQMDSTEFAVRWRGERNRRIDFLFIDADHDSSKLLADFFLLQEYVPEHTGLILLHDTFPVSELLLQKRFCSDAWKVAKIINRHSVFANYEIVTLPGPRAGLSIIRKAKTHGWMDEDSYRDV